MISNADFTSCEGGWQGGVISINGRGMQITIDHSSFQACKAGAIQNRDGKGGAVAVCGGLQSEDIPADHVEVKSCSIQNCVASGNGGASYVTIRGSLFVSDSTIETCEANDEGESPLTEGMGGAMHCSAGGYLTLNGNDLIRANWAAENGGGISIKSGKLFLNGTTSILANSAGGSAGPDHGNGGGIFVTTSYFDDYPTPPWSAPGWGAATLYGEHGYLQSSLPSLTMTGNTANRWGGAIHAGLSTALYNPLEPSSVHAPVAYSDDFRTAIRF